MNIVEAFARTAKIFAEKEVSQGKAPQVLLAKVQELGFFDKDYGIWSLKNLGETALASYALLKELAKEDASFALMVHSVAINNQLGTYVALERLAVHLNGKNDVINLPAGEVLTDFTAFELVPRMGLKRCRLIRIEGGKTKEKIERSKALLFTKIHIAGICAVALGSAEKALSIAKRYSEERYQGGKVIKEHHAVKILIGEALKNIRISSMALERALENLRETPMADLLSLWEHVRPACANTVSNCMQVLGGYGYMEDFGIEERLRDALTLRGLPPTGKRLLILLEEEVYG